MADPISSFSGLASGIQWRDLVDQIMSAESARRLSPVTAQATAQEKRVAAWNSYNGLLGKLGDAAKKLREGTAFGAFSATVGNSPTTSRSLLGVSASAGASPGSHKVEVLSLARAAKLGGGVVADSAAALGIAGDFVVGGRRIEVAATDSLAAVRDRINAANSGASPSGVTATILSTGPSSHRLVLNSDHTGSAGIDLLDGAAGTLGQLGFLDGTVAANATADGRTQSRRFSSTTSSIATMLGVTLPPPATVNIGGKSVSVDLSVDSLASIAARIQAAGGTAETTSETAGGGTAYRLKAGGTVSAATADGQRALEILGLTQRGRGAVAQSLLTGSTLTDGGGATATTSTLLTSLGTGGAAGGVVAGDTFTVRGTRADGSAVSLAYTVGGADTVQDFLDRINGADGFGRPGSPAATATLENGRIRLTDAAGGDSQLALAITASNEGGGTLGFGQTTTAVTGRLREVVAGSDARLRLDGVLLSRQGNAVSDALTGVTLSLQQAEPGTVVELSVARDTDAIVGSVKGFASAYNAVADFVKGQGAPGSPLAGNGTLRSTLSSLTSVLLTPVEGLGSTAYRRPTIAGVSLSRTGQLEVDDARLRAALASSLADVKALFGTAGTTTDGEVSFVNSTAKTRPGSYAVSVTAAATRPGVTGSGFPGVYSDDGGADTLTLTDAVSGKSGSIQLANGDTAEAIAAKLNTLFQTEGMKLSASRSGSQLSLAGTDYGSAASFTVAWSGGGSDGTAQLGLAAGTYAGTDVQGTLGGLAATGLGQVLSGAAGGATEGLAVKYTGSTARAAGSVGFVLGTGGMMTRLTDQLTRAGDGTVSGQVDSLRRSIDSLGSRAEEVQKRLDVRREAMVRQFTVMEQALGRIQSQGSWLAAQIGSLQPR